MGGVWLENRCVWLDGCDCRLERMIKAAKEKRRNSAENGEKKNSSDGKLSVRRRNGALICCLSFGNGDGRLEENQNEEF